MLDHLHIENFLTFERLEINQLKRVNLIAGKNNAGKTSLLEAIKLVKSDRRGYVLNDILFRFGLGKFSKTNLFNTIFNRKYSLGLKDLVITINNIELYKDEFDINLKIGEKGIRNSRFEGLIGNEIIKEEVAPNIGLYNFDKNYIYVPFYSDYETISNLWDDIALTSKEDDVLKILQESIEPDIIRFDVGRDKVRVRIKGVEMPVSLKTFGDGVQRILLIALSLANAQGKTLLIDEIELGLHYSVLEKLWEMIFKYSQLWDIQVFVTTHSKDAINAFHYVSSQEKYINDAEFIRLQKNRKGESEAIIYDGEKLGEVLDLSLEIR